MPPEREYRIFISHAWAHDHHYHRLVALLDRAPGFRWRNYSVPAYRSFDTRSDRALRAKLREQIRQSQVVLVIAGMFLNHREWMQTELQIAVTDFDKPVLGIRPQGQQRVPRLVDFVCDQFTGWSSRSIIPAIREIAL